MSVKKFIVGCFDEENALFSAVKNVRKSGYKIHDVYTPFPIHGLDRVMGLRDTSLHTAGFIYAAIAENGSTEPRMRPLLRANRAIVPDLLPLPVAAPPCSPGLGFAGAADTALFGGKTRKR